MSVFEVVMLSMVVSLASIGLYGIIRCLVEIWAPTGDDIAAARVAECGKAVVFMYATSGSKCWAMKVDAEGRQVTRYRIAAPSPGNIEYAIELFADGLPKVRLHRLPRLPKARQPIA